MARERLLRLYARDLPLALHPGDPVIAGTEGVTASFMRELVCRAVLRALAADPEVPVALDGELLGETLAELFDERSALSRALLSRARSVRDRGSAVVVAGRCKVNSRAPGVND